MAPGDLQGIHHVTAICGDAQRNVDFYAGVLGLRVVKLTVNFDDPTTYHLYYGDGIGSPGSIITFFPYPDSYQGRDGVGQVTTTSYAIPVGSLDAWIARFAELAIDFDAPAESFGRRQITLLDPDRLRIALVEADAPAAPEWEGATIPPEMAIRRFHAVRLAEEAGESTARLLTGVMGFREVGAEGAVRNYEVGPGGSGAMVEVLCSPDLPSGRGGQGSVHHVAFRTPDDARQAALRTALLEEGRNVSPIMDRNYFQSIYFREPGGVLFEVATDPPGFLIDETEENLGTHLKLPPQYERHRDAIVRRLPPLRLPNGIKIGGGRG